MGDFRLSPLVRSLSRLAPEADLADEELLERFCLGREEAAFALLVQRHGPTVLGVCRRLLGHADAEDAFQATFLILIRKAGSIRKRSSLGSWLYGVAYRMARKVRARSARLPVRPAAEAAVAEDDPLHEASRREWAALLHEEIHRLPENYRAPLVLCGLEGKTCEQAARELNWPKSSLAHRLDRGKELLRQRLVRRGVVLAAAVLASSLAKEARAAVSPTLTLGTVRLASQVLTGAAPATAPAVTLTNTMIKEMAMARWAAFLALVSVLGITVMGVALLASPADKPPAPPPPGSGPARADNPSAVHKDWEGNALPAGAVARVGSARLRHGRHVYHLTYSPDGKVLASVGDEVLNLWDAASGKPLAHVEIPKNEFFTKAFFCENGKSILVHGDGTCVWLDAHTGKEVRRVEVGPASPKAQGCLSPTGDAVAYIQRGQDTSRVILCELPSGKERQQWEAASWDWELAFSPDGKTLAAIDWEASRPINDQTRRVILFDTATGKRQSSITWDKERLGKLTFSADGTRLMAHHLGGGIRIWDTATGKEMSSLRAPNMGLVATAFTPDGTAVALGSQYVGVPLLDTRNGRELARFRALPTVSALAFSPDGKTLATAGGVGAIMQWDVAARALLPASADPPVGPRHLDFSADGKEIWSFADALTAHDWKTGKQTRRIDVPHDGEIARLAISPDRTRIAGVDKSQRLVVWDETGKVVSTLGQAARIIFTAAAFSRDGKRLYSGEWVGSVRVWDIASQKELDRFDSDKHTANVLRVSADGRLLAAADHPNAQGSRPDIIVWDLEKNSIVHRFQPRPQGFLASDIVLSPDGNYLAAVGGNSGLKEGFVTVWDLRTGQGGFPLGGSG